MFGGHPKGSVRNRRHLGTRVERREKILPTIAYGYTEFYGDYRGTISNVSRKPAGRSTVTSDVKKQLELLFGENYELSNGSDRPAVHGILIDALDECRNHRDGSKTADERRALLRCLIGLTKSNSWVKVLITSRREPDIE